MKLEERIVAVEMDIEKKGETSSPLLSSSLKKKNGDIRGTLITYISGDKK